MRSCASCATGGQPDGARFCYTCGAALTAPTCVACSAELVPGARFCGSCGAAQVGQTSGQVTGRTVGSGGTDLPGAVPVAARRTTSVLFGDLVAFTTYSESRDQEEVRELLSRYFDECRRVIDRYGGTVEKFIGDAVMAVWGVPTAHEDDAERAVRAGLELVGAVEALGEEIGLPELAMRVGIVTGEVAVTLGALDQGMVAGDAVNTAARVQSVARPGQVWVDETTRLLTTSAITYADAGAHALKGKADPVPLWSVRAVVANVGGNQRADGLEAPCTGRDRELRLVKELFHAVEETGRPALLVVDGDAGVGKTRLGWELSKYVDGLTRTVRWHNGRCLAYGEGVAFFALAEAIRGRLQNEYDGDTDDLGLLLANGLDRFVTDPDERAWLEPRLGFLLGTGVAGTFPREDLFAAWTTFFARVSEPGDPVVLVVDDAQHADDGLIAYLEHLLTAGWFPCFVMLLTRPGLLERHPRPRHQPAGHRAPPRHAGARRHGGG
ncbi:adenylate/guanylate cyclase domain-containing protein [Nocardioides sp. TF02-7]|uniref:adenylate/guanylate cyclase domain-containing protein n=1 Tax=Nocardioides sp. TF02-7 TaxID=2917724 RepID=UPI001F05E964|nr:adenylate/guanylate cyclase domain-containing protein [Nocardioides sp. TF02-7]UMG94231.1 AAA family ATPase [Nocardioides sp. TF02-7]